MKLETLTAYQVAAEAEFQLMACKDQLEWLEALVSAVQLDHEHGRGRCGRALSSLGKYLSDTGFAGVDSAISEFRAIADQKPAPQNGNPQNCGAALDGADLSERILAAREHASLSQADLSKLVGLEQASISQLESGRTKRTGHLAEIARACGVDVNWLAFGLEGAQ